MHANDAPLYGLTQEQVRARREQGRTNTMPRRAEGGLADILRRNVLTLFNLLNLCLAGLLLWVGSHRDMLFLGVVLSGRVMVEHSDIWGNRAILGSAAPGAVFGEAYACIPGEPLQVCVSAMEKTDLLLLNVGKVLTTCTRACPFHTKLVRNLLAVCAAKNLQLSGRILHTSSKSIRGRLLSYFSECAKRAGSYSFRIPYNRQQLADYLGVDRSAMCNELSKMQKDGLIRYEKNDVLLGEANLPSELAE